MPKRTLKRKTGMKYKVKNYPVEQWAEIYGSGKTIKQIAGFVGVGKNTVAAILKRADIVVKRKGKNKHQTFLDSFKVNEDTGCWEWLKYINNKGYGILRIADETLTHRYSYKYFKGEIGDLHVCHKCDNPKCVNPDHLFLGTRSDNMVDRTLKGRSKVAKLNVQKVLEIRALINESELTFTEIGRMYCVDRKTIRSIHTRYTWKHVA